jgi:hypothetical protein
MKKKSFTKLTVGEDLRPHGVAWALARASQPMVVEGE